MYYCISVQMNSKTIDLIREYLILHGGPEDLVESMKAFSRNKMHEVDLQDHIAYLCDQKSSELINILDRIIKLVPTPPSLNKYLEVLRASIRPQIIHDSGEWISLHGIQLLFCYESQVPIKKKLERVEQRKFVHGFVKRPAKKTFYNLKETIEVLSSPTLINTYKYVRKT